MYTIDRRETKPVSEKGREQEQQHQRPTDVTRGTETETKWGTSTSSPTHRCPSVCPTEKPAVMMYKLPVFVMVRVADEKKKNNKSTYRVFEVCLEDGGSSSGTSLKMTWTLGTVSVELAKRYLSG